jgi:hypothetical protein
VEQKRKRKEGGEQSCREKSKVSKT